MSEFDSLLARTPADLNVARVRDFLAGRTALVTGAAGSIGSELCRRLAGHGISRLVLFDHHENGVFKLETELRDRHPSMLYLEPVLGDILQPDLDTIFSMYKPDIVFHAAAYKHVPLAERNVLKAVRNNVLGTRNVAQAALANGAKNFVLVSTDKAVRPESVMGVSKRIAEMVVQTLEGGSCRFATVRFGNVLSTSGSVVPLFRDQIAKGGPLTVTDPEVTRYFMTIAEAVELILQAATMGSGGEVFVFEMGKPVRIVDLARHMIRLSGFEPDEIGIVFTGLKPGEKLHEELVNDEELIIYTFQDRIKVLRPQQTPSDLNALIDSIDLRVQQGNVAEVVNLLQAIVPEYRPSTVLGAREVA